MRKLIFIAIGLIFLVKQPVLAQQEIEMLIINRDYPGALYFIEKEISTNPSAELFYKKGVVLNSLQNYGEAILAFQNAIQTDSVNLAVMAELAENYAILGNYQDAAYWFEKTLKLQPENLSLLAKSGRNYISLKDFKMAYICFSDVYAKDSTNIYWNKQLAFSAFRVGKRKQAVELYTKVLEANPRDYSTYLNLVKLFDREKEDSLIIQTFQKGIEQFPSDAELQGEFAKYFFESKKYEQARMNYEIYFSLKGDSIYPVMLNYGISLYFTSAEAEAVTILEKCVIQQPNDPFPLFYLGLCHKKLKNFELSEGYMKSAIEAATPSYLPDLYHYLGQILGLQRKFPESIAALQKANELDPENTEVLFEIASTYEEYNSNKTLALNYYNLYLKEAGEEGKNIDYALTRMKKLKEDLFFDE
jgi:tetratricopeptide (TPR) repeat protein